MASRAGANGTAAAARRHVAGLPGLLRAARHAGHLDRRGHQRGARVHLHAGVPHPRAAALGAGRGLRRPGRHLPRRDPRGLQGRAGRDALAAAAPVRHDPRGHGGAGHPGDRGAGLRGRRRHRHAGHRGGGAPDARWSSSPGTATASSWSQDPYVRVLYNKRGVSDYTLYDEAGIIERTGVPPSQYVLLASLRGDPSDNLPGVPGRGGEDGGQAADQVRRPRRDLRAPRRADAEAAREPGRQRGAGPLQRPHHPAGARRAARRRRRPTSTLGGWDRGTAPRPRSTASR